MLIFASQTEYYRIPMSKSPNQIVKFLEQYKFKSEMDWKGISSFCLIEFDLSLDEITPEFSEDGIDFAIFSTWLTDGFGSGDIVCYDGNISMIGACNLETVKIEATLIGDKIECHRIITEISNLTVPSKADIELFEKAMFLNKLQFEETRQLVIERHIPVANERVSFKKDGMYGIGVVRSASQEDDSFELYCYYIYRKNIIKHSMHETIGKLSDFIFQTMTRGERNRLKKELKKLGKNWNDKMHRIEPIDGEAKVGEKYWYIDDKMKMVCDIEKGKSPSHHRFLGGNYFLNPDDCLENLGAINEILRNFLAK